MENHTNETTAIRNVQRYLRQLSYHEKAIPHAPIDGIWETDTRNALIAFQRQMGLPVTGVADRKTFDTLYAAYLGSVALYAPPDQFDIFPKLPDGYSVGPGDTQFLVRVIQYILDELPVIYDDLGPITQNGIYDPATERAIRQFQLRNELEVTGRVNKYTWNKLNTEHNKYNDATAQ